MDGPVVNEPTTLLCFFVLSFQGLVPMVAAGTNNDQLPIVRNLLRHPPEVAETTPWNV